MKQHALRLMVCGIVLAVLVLLSACARQPQPARIEEITFQSGEFTLVGDLRTPAGRRGPFPVILIVEGSIPGTRFDMWPIEQLVLQDGYAAFAWDAPAHGETDLPPRKWIPR